MAAFVLLIGAFRSDSFASAAPVAEPTNEWWDSTCGLIYQAYEPHSWEYDTRVPQADARVSCWTEGGLHKWEIRQDGMAGNDASKPAFAISFIIPEATVCRWSGWQATLWNKDWFAIVERFASDGTVLPRVGRQPVVVDDFVGGEGAGFLIICEGVLGDLPDPTSTPSATSTATATPSPTPSPTATSTSTSTPSATSTATATTEPTVQPTATPSPTATVTSTPTAQPTVVPISFLVNSSNSASIDACEHALDELPSGITLETADGSAVGQLIEWEGIFCGGFAASFNVTNIFTVTIFTSIPLTISQEAMDAGWSLFVHGWRRELPQPPAPPVDPWICTNPMTAEKLVDGVWQQMPFEYQPIAHNVDGRLIVGQWNIAHPSEQHGFCLMLPPGQILVRATGSRVLTTDRQIVVDHREDVLHLDKPTWVFVQEDAGLQGGVVFEGPAVTDASLYTRGLIQAGFLPMVSR